jgi:hypothetical protein
MIGGISVTPVKLAVLGVFLLALGWLAIFHNPFQSTKPTARPMDVFQARFRVGKLNSSRIPDGTKVFLEGLRGADLVVMRPNSKSDTMVVTFTISGKALDRMFGDKSMIAKLRADDLQLQCGDQVSKPICFLVAELDSEKMNWYYRRQDNAEEVGATVEPGGRNSPTLKVRQANDRDWDVQSDSGMSVACTMKPEEDRVQITWDKKSTGWKAIRSAERPSTVGLGWDVTCLFPKPADVKNMQLKVYREPPMQLVWAPE